MFCLFHASHAVTSRLQTITIKEGIQYRLRIEFHVQRDIVTGLRYTQKTYRKGIQGQYLVWRVLCQLDIQKGACCMWLMDWGSFKWTPYEL